MMTGNGADIECYAYKENQPVQMGCAVLDSPKYSTSGYPESGIIPPKCVFAVRDRVQCRHEHPGGFSARHPVHSGNCVP